MSGEGFAYSGSYKGVSSDLEASKGTSSTYADRKVDEGIGGKNDIPNLGLDEYDILFGNRPHLFDERIKIAQRENSKKIILTGGPASGKSTAINALKERGYNIIPEAARDVISHHSHVVDTYARQKLIYLRQLEYELSHTKPGKNILDRSLVDIVAYCALLGVPVPMNLYESLGEANYERQVILLKLPPSKEQYNLLSQDGLRFETYEMAKTIERLLLDAYKISGHKTTIIPWKESKQERLEDVLKSL
jgi:predicted ATPase